MIQITYRLLLIEVRSIEHPLSCRLYIKSSKSFDDISEEDASLHYINLTKMFLLNISQNFAEVAIESVMQFTSRLLSRLKRSDSHIKTELNPQESMLFTAKPLNGRAQVGPENQWSLNLNSERRRESRQISEQTSNNKKDHQVASSRKSSNTLNFEPNSMDQKSLIVARNGSQAILSHEFQLDSDTTTTSRLKPTSNNNNSNNNNKQLADTIDYLETFPILSVPPKQRATFECDLDVRMKVLQVSSCV